jgi:hypothetical protein
MSDQQRAGLVLFGTRPTWIGVVRDAGVSYLTYASAGVETRGPSLAGEVINLKAQVSPDQSVRFAYAADPDAPYQWFGPETALSRFSWWKGARPGLFTYIRQAAGSASDAAEDGYADFDWFHVEPSP